MAKPRSYTSDRLLEVLGWDWTDREQIIRELVPTVAPGIAIRKYQGIYERGRERYLEMGRHVGHGLGTGNPRAPRPVEEQIRSGARAIVLDAIWGAINRTRVETKKEGNVTYLRRIERRRGFVAVERTTPDNKVIRELTREVPVEVIKRVPDFQVRSNSDVLNVLGWIVDEWNKVDPTHPELSQLAGIYFRVKAMVNEDQARNIMKITNEIAARRNQ